MVKNQRYWNWAFMSVMFFFFLLLAQINWKLALNLGLGIGLGFALEKSRFCFVAAFRDPILTGMTALSQAVILLLGVSILGFALVAGSGQGYALNVYPLGANTIVGGLLFGIGMVLAGGCASGILMRIGEGFAMQMLALAGALVGVFFGERSLRWWQGWGWEQPGIFLPAKLGWLSTLSLEMAVLVALWLLARWWENR
ncbi:MAG: YeeE/YedE thiosulfate transporter family protein [Desulfitobacteriaceae bacterium]|nr:YeeE/YedE thiosulfate transporter family protein [Desulfitobacteriaceae bacterium]MDI6914659.1 YeeE/YedE thiosulfate transporter family protein [Desulfitobacteriaceae bacterium]